MSMEPFRLELMIFRTLKTRFALITLFVLAAMTASWSQTKKPAQNPAWQVNCSAANDPSVLSCQMAQTLTLTKTGQRLLTVIVKPQPEQKKKEPLLVLSLPHGLLLPAGVQLQVDDGKKSTIAIRTSNKNGALTATSLNRKFVAALKGGTLLKVTMTANNNKPVTVGVSLAGFSAAIEKIHSVK